MTVEETKQAKLSDESIALTAVHCTSHKDKLCELYCEKCRVPICSMCLTTRSNHKGHEVIDLQEVADRFCKFTKDQVTILKEKEREVKQSKISATKQLEGLTIEHLQRKQHIQKHSMETIEKLTKSIKQKEASLLGKLKTDYNKRKEDIKTEMHQYDTKEELLTTTITFMNNLLLCSSSAQLMTTSEETEKKLKTMVSLDTKCNDTHDSLPQFYPGDIELKGILGSFHTPEVDSVSHASQQSQESSHAINAPMKLERTIGGDESRMFSVPLGVGINICGDIVVADEGNETVQIVDKFGRPKSQLQFTGYSKTVSPIDVAISLDNAYFITDGSWVPSAENQVIVCNQYGKVIKCFGAKELKYPYGIAINHNNGIVYVVDNDAHCIRLYEMASFKYIKSVGSKGQGSCNFESPKFIAINSNGCLIVSDTGNDRIQVLSSDGECMFVFHGCENDYFSFPCGVATDKNDNIYVCDYEHNRVQKFNSKGAFITNSVSGSDVHNPIGVAVTDDGKIIVTDDTRCVRIYS
uniref:Tripartite motif-containing protein 2-like n=1 Tax=Saccoglossus kowalevskii TaxID=10224 RepID=A0ABM0MER4_SACKO|nr:PREDICTED: tripartite motif-containing protein 2-like [Saccoglossus kowalevskii]